MPEDKHPCNGPCGSAHKSNGQQPGFRDPSPVPDGFPFIGRENDKGNKVDGKQYIKHPHKSKTKKSVKKTPFPALPYLQAYHYIARILRGCFSAHNVKFGTVGRRAGPPSPLDYAGVRVFTSYHSSDNPSLDGSHFGSRNLL